MTSSVIDFTVLECNGREVREQKWADLRILIGTLWLNSGPNSRTNYDSHSTNSVV